ncbi:uncharacterized protein K02A2.6-like [Anthonomus grandis grandis]|uniref:uncharacterized protein K02A2.6-like n=1 Tax=Anthonomus grandis grandis TaxID=2921223 RepID=UPI0021664D07|nr:uncharacterized protein K02A2.6-like [Anthonomus grandis grandis]
MHGMSNINSASTIQALRRVFATFGLPVTLVSDNGRQLVLDDFKTFLSKNNIKHLTSPPYSPASNDAAENAVRTVKSALKKALVSNSIENVSLTLCRFLLDYRVTPHCTTGVSPVVLMFGRDLRTRLSSLLPASEKSISKSNLDIQKVGKRVEQAQNRQIENSKPSKKINFEINEPVLVKNYKIVDKPTFIKGVISKKLGKRTYLVRIPDLDRNWKRHCNQVKKYTLSSSLLPKIPISSDFGVSPSSPSLELDNYNENPENFVNNSVNIDSSIELEGNLAVEETEGSFEETKKVSIG